MSAVFTYDALAANCDERLGRWMTPDWAAQAEPVPYAKLDNPQSLNLYAYAGNNPVTNVDADGHCLEDACVGEGTLAIGVGGLAVIAGLNAYLHTPAGQSATEAFANAAGASISNSVASIKNALHHVLQSKASGPKAANAPGVTAGGQATDEYGNKLGPSGEAQIDRTRSNTREGARNKALNTGSGAVDHSNPTTGNPHFQPTDQQGKKKPNSVHHEYPRN